MKLAPYQPTNGIFPGKTLSVGCKYSIFAFRLKFEEFALWMILGSMYVLTWYEYFEDDGK